LHLLKCRLNNLDRCSWVPRARKETEHFNPANPPRIAKTLKATAGIANVTH
jgi:hypothetical protein